MSTHAHAARRPDGSLAQSLRLWLEDAAGGLTRIATEDGVAHITGIAPGEVKIVLVLSDTHPPEFYGLQRTLRIALGTLAESLEVDFQGGAKVYGILEADPNILAGRSFNFGARRLDDTDSPSVATNSQLAGGRYFLAGLSAGRWLLRMRSTNFGSNVGAERELVVEEGKTYEVGSAAVAGAVKDARGQPIAGAAIAVRRRADGDAREKGKLVDSWHRDTSKPDGTYRVEGLFPGPQEFVVEARGFGRLEGELTEVSLEKLATRDFTLEEDCTVRVVVVDLGGKEIEKATIELARVGSSSAPFLLSEGDSRGCSILHGASTGSHILSVRAAEFFPFQTTLHCIAGEDITATASLRRPAHLAIRVKDTRGELLRGVPVTITDVATATLVESWLETGLVSTAGGSLVTDDGGELRVTGVPEGRYEVVVAGINESLETSASDAEPKLVLVPR